MSLMKTLARVAAGVMVAKGVGAIMKNQRGGQSSRSGSGQHSQQGSGGLLGSLLGNNTDGRGGSITDQLGKVLGGGAGSGKRYGGPNSAGAQGGLGGLLDGLSGRSGGSSGGGLGGLIGGLLGGAAGGAVAGGAVAGSLAEKGSQPKNDATFGELFNDSVTRNDEPEVAPTPEQNATAGIMLKAMIQAAKSDGTIDEAEKKNLLGQLGDDLDAEEREFIREQMAAPVDAAALAKEVPAGLEQQTYLMSLLAIDFDNEQEARYLNSLAEAMGLSREAVNKIHEEAGVMPLYSK